MYDEPVSRQEGGVFKIYLLNRNRQIRHELRSMARYSEVFRIKAL